MLPIRAYLASKAAYNIEVGYFQGKKPCLRTWSVPLKMRPSLCTPGWLLVVPATGRQDRLSARVAEEAAQPCSAVDKLGAWLVLALELALAVVSVLARLLAIADPLVEPAAHCPNDLGE